MTKTGDILKQFRKNRGVTQNDLCKDIITRQTYSKIENNQQEPNYEILIALLQKLNYSISDFTKELGKYDKINDYYTLFLKGPAGELSMNEASSLYSYVNKNKNNDVRSFYLYARVKGHLHPKFKTIIPNYTDEDKKYFNNFIENLSTSYSLNDLKMIADLTTHLLDYEKMIKLYKKLPDFSPFDYGEDSEMYRIQIHKLYNNFCDIAISRNDLDIAKEMLIKHKAFAKIHPEMRYLIYIKINEVVLTFQETKNYDLLKELLIFSETCEAIGDTSTAAAIKYQHDILKNNSKYNPTKAITTD